MLKEVLYSSADGGYENPAYEIALGRDDENENAFRIEIRFGYAVKDIC